MSNDTSTDFLDSEWTVDDFLRLPNSVKAREGVTVREFHRWKLAIDDYSVGMEWELGQTVGGLIRQLRSIPAGERRNRVLAVPVEGGDWEAPVVRVEIDRGEKVVWLLIESCCPLRHER